MKFSPLRLLAYVGFYLVAVALFAYLLLRLISEISVSPSALWAAAIVLGVGLLLIASISAVPGIIAMRRLVALRRDFPNAEVYRATPYGGFDELVNKFPGTGATAPAWDTYLLQTEEYLSFVSGAHRSEILTLRRSQVVVSTGYYFGWVSIFPVIRLSVPGFSDAAFALPISSTLGLLSHSTHFLKQAISNLPQREGNDA